MLVPIVELYKLCVVSLCKGSLGSHIDKHSALLSLHEVAEYELVLIEISHHNRPKFADEVALIPVISCLPRRPKANASLSISHLALVFLLVNSLFDLRLKNNDQFFLYYIRF